MGEKAEQNQLVTKIMEKRILGVDEDDEDKVRRRVAFHWKEYKENPDARGASALLAAVIDLPARWIEDVSTGRR